MLKPPGSLRVRLATACCAAGLAPTTPTGRSRGPIRAAGHANASTASTAISGSTTETTNSRRHGKNFASVFHIADLRIKNDAGGCDHRQDAL
jgi:hypothetical protein